VTGLKISDAKSFFFDRAAVTGRISAGLRRVLSRFGAHVRTAARRSMRPAGKSGRVSEPGTPPRTRTGLLRKLLLFSYDPASQSVIIGPAAINGTGPKALDGATTPSVLETGGRIELTEVQVNGQWRVGARIANEPTRRRAVEVKARPYMGPAFQAELKKLPPNWRDSI
jgi:hypothetical protein